MNRKKTAIISIVILLVGALVTLLIFLTEPAATKEGATKETAMLVEIMAARKGNYHPVVEATGTVVPSKDITLSPRISGEVVEISNSFVPGGFVSQGEILVRIDSSDYRNNLQLRKSELKQALAALEIEMGRQDVARQDYELIGEELSGQNEALVLREPQLNTAKARVEAARAAVQQARLHLERSVIKAPFNAHILTRNVNTGSQVAPGQNLGRLVGMDEYWVETTVPLSKLSFLKFPENSTGEGSKVVIRNRSAWQQDEFRNGYLDKMIGALESQTRLARILVTVPDPLAHYSDNHGKPVLFIGSFVQVEINGKEIFDVVRINRDYLRKNDKIWVMKNNRLEIRDVKIDFRDAGYAYISEGIEENDTVVTTNLSTVVEGVKLRIAGQDTPKQHKGGVE